MRDVFNAFDQDKDGTISLEEVRGIMRRLGRTPDEERLTEMFNQADLDGQSVLRASPVPWDSDRMLLSGNGKIDFTEFLTLVEHRVHKGPHQKELQEMFSVFDRDKNGYIDRSELKSTMAEMGMVLSDVDIQEMLKEAQVADSRLYYEGIFSERPLRPNSDHATPISIVVSRFCATFRGKDWC